MPHPSESHLAPFAIVSDASSGRHHIEPVDPLRSMYELDRHRVIESTAFRRLEGKTQVFSPAHHDHFRTRLTHTLEAAQIARTLAVGLGANELLAEAITLAHDLGHPPFGHAGERALGEAMASCGGFNHNTHSLRVVEHLEHPIPAFHGLNLSIETLDGLATHETRYDRPLADNLLRANPSAAEPTRAAGFSPRGLSHTDRAPQGGAAAYPSVESRIASISDRIAYDCHDLEDAIGAGFCDLDSLGGVDLWREAFEATDGASAAAHIFAIRRVVLDAVLDRLLTDVIFASQGKLEGIDSPEQASATPSPLIVLSPEVEDQLCELERFLVEQVYRRPEIAEADAEGRRIVLALFEAYCGSPGLMPDRFAARVDEQGVERVACDYIAGMTDRFCKAALESVQRSHT